MAIIAMLTIAAGALVWLAWAVWSAWQGGQATDWGGFWSGAWNAVRLVGLMLFMAFGYLQLWQGQALTAMLRRGALAGDDGVAPVAERQPDALAESPASESPEEIGPLPASQSHLPDLQAGIGILLFVLGVGFGALAIAVGPDLIRAGSDRVDFGLVVLAAAMIAVVALVLLGGGGFLLWAAWRFSRGVRVLVDDAGLAARPSPTRRVGRIAWREVRAFYVTAGAPRRQGASVLLSTSTMYAVDTGTWRFTWTMPEGATPYQWEQHTRLCQLVATRTGLPLRDAFRAAARRVHVADVATRTGLPLRDASAKLLDIAQFYAARGTTALRDAAPDVAPPNRIATETIPAFAHERHHLFAVGGVQLGILVVLLLAGLILQHMPAR